MKFNKNLPKPPSCPPHSQSGPRTTFAPTKIPFNCIFVASVRGDTRVLLT